MITLGYRQVGAYFKGEISNLYLSRSRQALLSGVNG